MRNSVRAYSRSGPLPTSPRRRTNTPAPQDPAPIPSMNIESVIETSAVVTPNWAMVKRSQMSSYKMLQNPDSKKKRKYQLIVGLGFPPRMNRSCTAGLSSCLDEPIGSWIRGTSNEDGRLGIPKGTRQLRGGGWIASFTAKNPPELDGTLQANHMEIITGD